MPSQPFSRASPSEGSTIVRQVMADAVAFYLDHGGPAVAREHVEKLANDLKFYHDCTEAYREALEQIRLAEETERQQAEASHQQELHDLMKLMMNTFPSVQKRQQPATGTAGHDGADTGEVVLPPKLNCPKARRMLQRLQEAGYIDERYQPVRLSRTKSAVLADEMSVKLASENDNLMGIDDKWKPFEILWHKNNMRADHYRSLNQKSADVFRGKIRTLFADI